MLLYFQGVIEMCFSQPSSNSGGGAKKNTAGDLSKQYNDPTSPYYRPPVVYKTDPIKDPNNPLNIDYEKLSEGPEPTVLGAKASTLALSTRRRKLRESYRFGLSSHFKPVTREGTGTVSASVPKNNNFLSSGKGRIS